MLHKTYKKMFNSNILFSSFWFIVNFHIPLPLCVNEDYLLPHMCKIKKSSPSCKYANIACSWSMLYHSNNNSIFPSKCKNTYACMFLVIPPNTKKKIKYRFFFITISNYFAIDPVLMCSIWPQKDFFISLFIYIPLLFKICYPFRNFPFSENTQFSA